MRYIQFTFQTISWQVREYLNGKTAATDHIESYSICKNTQIYINKFKV